MRSSALEARYRKPRKATPSPGPRAFKRAPVGAGIGYVWGFASSWIVSVRYWDETIYTSEWFATEAQADEHLDYLNKKGTV